MQLLARLMRTASAASRSTLAARRREFDQAKATFVQIIFAFLCRALAKMTKRKEKILVKWARVSSNYFLEAH